MQGNLSLKNKINKIKLKIHEKVGEKIPPLINIDLSPAVGGSKFISTRNRLEQPSV